MAEPISTLEQQSGVIGRTSLPPTILPTPDQQTPYQQQFAAPQRTPDSGALLDMAIQRKAELQQQRFGITNQRSQLIDQLSHAPMGRHGRTSPQAMAIQARLHGLDRQEHALDAQDKFIDFDTSHRITSAFRGAADAERFAKENLAHQTAQQAGEVFLKGTEIMGKYKPGTPEFQDAMTQLRDQYPLGFASEAVKGHFGQIAKFHDQEQQRVQNALTTTLLKNNLSPEQFASVDPSTIRGTNAPIGSTLEAIEKGRANTGAKGEKAQNIAFDVDGQTMVMEKALFNTLSKHFRKPQKNQVSVAAVAAPSEDAYAQSQGFRGAAQLEQFRRTGKVIQPSGQTAAKSAQALMPPLNPQERVQGQIYTNPSGKRARWTGTGWSPLE